MSRRLAKLAEKGLEASGKSIAEMCGKQLIKEVGWKTVGKEVLKELSDKLTADFGKGFDYRNLQYMKKFYELFQNMNSVSSQLSWTHYRHLLKVED